MNRARKPWESYSQYRASLSAEERKARTRPPRFVHVSQWFLLEGGQFVPQHVGMKRGRLAAKGHTFRREAAQ